MQKAPIKYLSKPLIKDGYFPFIRSLVLCIIFLCSFSFISVPVLVAQLLGDESNNGMKSIDMDGDGDLDVVSVSGLESEFRIFVNNGSGYDVRVIQSGIGLNGVFTVADFNGDGAPDVALVQVNTTNGRHRPVFYINMFHTNSTTANNFGSTPTASPGSYNNRRVSGTLYFRRHTGISYINNPQERIVSFASGDVGDDGDIDLLYGHITTGSLSERRAKWYRAYVDNGIYRIATSQQIPLDLTNSPPGVAGNIGGIQDVHHIRLANLNGDSYPDLVVFSTGDVYNPIPFNGAEVPAIHTYEYKPTISQFRYLEEDIGAVELNEVDGTTVTLNQPNGFEVQDLDGDGDPEMIIATTNPNTGQTKLLIAGDNNNDTTFVDIEIPVSLGDFEDFELVDTDNDGVVDQVVVLSTDSGGTSSLSTFNFVPANNDGSGQDALTTGSTVTLDETSYSIVVVDDGNGGSAVVNDSQNTSELVPAPEPPTFTSVGLKGDESANGMISVDIDGDGDEDVYSASNRDNVIRWFRNDAGTYTPILIQSAIEVNGVLTAADFNGDSTIDLAIVDSVDTNNYQVWVYLNQIDPDADTGNNFSTSLTNTSSYTEINGFRRFLAASNMQRITSLQNIDLNNDSDRDIIFTQFGSSSFESKQLTNTNNLSLSAPTNLALNGSKTKNIEVLRVADFNGDGIEDIVWVSAQGDPRVGTASASGSGFNEDILGTNTVESASDLSVQDLDGDGDFEILMASTDSNGSTSIYIFGDNQDNNSFDAVEVPITGINNFSDFAITDTDGDGDLDLTILTTDEGAGTSQVVTYTFADDLNDGSGQDAFTAGAPINLDEPSYEILVVIDQDGNTSLINDTDDTSALIEKAGNVIKVDYQQGWNLIAQPGRQVESSNFFQAVESSNLPVFFELQNGNSFGLASTPKEGVGYWVYYETDPAEVTVTAKVNNVSTVNIAQGWNLIGSGSRSVSVQAIYDLYPSVANDALNIFSYNAQTSSFLQLSNTGTPDSLRPGQGYYFEAPAALNDVDINGRKIKVQNGENSLKSEDVKIPFYFGINERYEQKLVLNFSRNIPIPPSMTPKKSWLIGNESEKLYSTTKELSLLHYESDTVDNLSIRLDSISQKGYLLIDGIYKVYPEYTIQLPYKDLKGEISIEWIAESNKDDNTIVDVDLDNLNIYKTALNANYPNPFNPTTTIPYSISEPQNVVLSIYNMNGQKVWSKNLGNQSAGNYSITWNAANYASGIYLVELRTSANIRDLRRMTLMK